MPRQSSQDKGITAESEITSGQRFQFGKNWKRYAKKLNQTQLKDADESLQFITDRGGFEGKSFLDVGSGSGIFSLAARNRGARVLSFDYDPDSVECTVALRSSLRPNDPSWTICEGSVLDEEFMESLGKFDIVYSWGVLHHTGNLESALRNTASVVNEGGLLHIAIYNRQKVASRYWFWVKKTYVKFPILRPAFYIAHFLYPTLASIVVKAILRKKIPRGMAIHTDLLDWLGGFPFEVASPEEVLELFTNMNFRLVKLRTVGSRSGNNEFLFERV